MTVDDLDRLCTEYANRTRRLVGSDIYSHFNQANLFTLQQRQRDTLALLRNHGFFLLENRSFLELGCGTGGVLLEFLAYGMSPAHLHGTDLIFDRLRHAQIWLSHLPITCSDGQSLPYADNSFDLILQYTVFSSVLVENVKVNIANEMLRVLSPDGMILWYDFWFNPTNPQTSGIRLQEIRKLFPDCRFDFHRVTLAPPISRRLIKISWLLCLLLEKLRLFNSHYLVAIHPTSKIES